MCHITSRCGLFTVRTHANLQSRIGQTDFVTSDSPRRTRTVWRDTVLSHHTPACSAVPVCVALWETGWRAFYVYYMHHIDWLCHYNAQQSPYYFCYSSTKLSFVLRDFGNVVIGYKISTNKFLSSICSSVSRCVELKRSRAGFTTANYFPNNVNGRLI